MRNLPRALALSSALMVSAKAAEPAKELQIEALAARIQALEANAQALQKQAAEALTAAHAAQSELQQMKAAQQSNAVAAVSAEAEDAAPASSASANAFNPAISLILNGLFDNHSLNPDDYQRAGFPLVGEGQPSVQGLHLGESELTFSANIDDKFYGQLTVALESDGGDTEVGIEEAYIDTTALPEGFKIRAGRFFSGIGYLNSRHTHTDFFTDRPLSYQAFLGNQYGDDGVQLLWVAPTETFLQLGTEAFRGDNYPNGGAAHNGVGAQTFFANVGGDVGIENSWLTGVSTLRATTTGGEDGFKGSDNLYLFDFTWKWAPRGAFKDAGIVLRSEVILSDRDGVVLDPNDPDSIAQPWTGTRRGGYIEGIYRFSRSWDAGYRFDKLWAASDGPYASDYDPQSQSAMLTWHNSEFSLLRLQLTHDEPQPDLNDNVFTLQYQVSLGAHGAHKF